MKFFGNSGGKPPFLTCSFIENTDLTVEIHNRIPGVAFRNLFADVLLADWFGGEVAFEFIAVEAIVNGNLSALSLESGNPEFGEDLGCGKPLLDLVNLFDLSFINCKRILRAFGTLRIEFP